MFSKSILNDTLQCAPSDSPTGSRGSCGQIDLGPWDLGVNTNTISVLQAFSDPFLVSTHHESPRLCLFPGLRGLTIYLFVYSGASHGPSLPRSTFGQC